jgi:hypothetical protein
VLRLYWTLAGPVQVAKGREWSLFGSITMGLLGICPDDLRAIPPEFLSWIELSDGMLANIRELELAGTESTAGLDAGRLIAMYTQMVRIREFEERVKATFTEHPGVIRGHTHLADGAEASIVGSQAALGPRWRSRPRLPTPRGCWPPRSATTTRSASSTITC